MNLTLGRWHTQLSSEIIPDLLRDQILKRALTHARQDALFICTIYPGITKHVYDNLYSIIPPIKYLDPRFRDTFTYLCIYIFIDLFIASWEPWCSFLVTLTKNAGNSVIGFKIQYFFAPDMLRTIKVILVSVGPFMFVWWFWNTM